MSIDRPVNNPSGLNPKEMMDEMMGPGLGAIAAERGSASLGRYSPAGPRR